MALIKNLKGLKVAVDIGHNCPHNGGAVSGSVKEDVLTMEVGKKVIALLKSLGCIVIETLPKTATSQLDALQRRCKVANDNDVDLFVCIHFNKCTGGYGTEVYVYDTSNAKSVAVANRILKGFEGMGYRNRGVKDDSLYVIRHTKADAYLVECCFIDSASDMAKYNPDKMAKAIVEGLLDIKIDDAPTDEYEGLPNGDVQRDAIVTADVLNVRSGRGTNYPVIGQLHKGDKINLWYCRDKWASMDRIFKVKDKDGKLVDNFLHTKYVKVI